MKRSEFRGARQGCTRPAFSMAEMIVSIVVVAVMLTAALQAVSLVKRSEKTVGEQARGQLLAQQLMTEILAQDYADASFGPDSFGLGADEITGTRSLFEDVDDYDGWTARPPQYKDGTVQSELGEWCHAVSVEWVSPNDLAQVVGSNQGVKRIIVMVTRQDVEVARLTAVRTYAGDLSRSASRNAVVVPAN